MSTDDLARRTDEELVRQAQAGPDTESGREAAAELIGRYQRTVYLWCCRQVRDPDDARDLAQDAMLDAWRGLAGFGGRARFSTWLFLIVRNRCLSALRPRILERDPAADPDELEADWGDPEALLLQDETGRELERLLLEELDPREQDAIWLRCVECLPVEEITRRLGLSAVSGARGLLQTARRKLRAALRRRGQPEL